MRNIASIDISKTSYELGYTNEDSNANEIILSILSVYLENPYIEITKQDASVESSDVLTSGTNIEYAIPSSYLYTIGTLKIRILADGYSSKYIVFDILEKLTSTDSIILKKSEDKYIIKKVASYKYYDLPIASKSSLGGIIVGDNLEIDNNGVLSAVGGGSSGTTTNYNDLTNKPSINGTILKGSLKTSDLNISYEDLNNKPTIPTVPKKVSEFENDSNYLTSIPTEYITETELNEKGYLTSVPSTYKTKTENDNLYQPKGNYLTSYTESDPTVPSHVKSITSANITSWNNKSNFSGNYNDLTNKPTIPIVPTEISAFTNDAGYLTSVPSEYVTETELNAKGYLTQHQSLKTINGESLVGSGNITISSGSGSGSSITIRRW